MYTFPWLLTLSSGLTQPRSQGLSPPHSKGNDGRKTLAQAGHVPPKKVGVTNKQREGAVTKLQFCLSLLFMEEENLSKKI